MSYPQDAETSFVAAAPLVSVIVANFNGERTIVAALESALAQTLRNIEVVVADDGSTDQSVDRITALAQRDARVRLLPQIGHLGVAAARNRCLAAARGDWIAVLDGDDLMHPERLELLIAAAEPDRADIAADDLLIFHDDAQTPPNTCLSGDWARGPRWIGLADYVRANAMFRRRVVLGYLKPLIRADVLRRTGVTYDPSLRIGEDYDFIARLLAGGARFRVYPTLTYFYRKHVASVSHRLSVPVIDEMLAANDTFITTLAPQSPSAEVTAALAERAAMLRRARAVEILVTAIKRRAWGAALATALRAPGAALVLRQAVWARLRRVRKTECPPGPRRATLISRQRVVGRTSGSSAYLLDLVNAVADRGLAPYLVCPSPAVFGRIPVLRLGAEMRVFHGIHIRGSWRLGHYFVATDPRVWQRAAAGLMGQLLWRLGLPVGWLNRPAPYAIAVPWQRDDILYLARHARPTADLLIADYAFLAAGIPFVLRPESPSLVVMHDLFSSRANQFDRLGIPDSVAALDLDGEMRLLGMADAVIAIQPEEAAVVRTHLPATQVLVVPIAATPANAASPGEQPEVLFVGSKTAPNVIGLRWFLDEVWPAIRHTIPSARLVIAGSVAGEIRSCPPGVMALGYRADLTPLYQRAAVVISPLLAGSGLKIKLVEALGHGKAMVVTTTTLQGVDADVRDAVLVADTAADFARAVLRLLQDRPLRTAQAAAGLAAAARHYAPARSHAALNEFLDRALPTPTPRRTKLAYFVHDLADPAVHRRMRMLTAIDEIVLIGFHRGADPVHEVAGRRAIDLGRTFDGRFAHRAGSVLRAALDDRRFRAEIAGSTLFMARTLEMLTLAAVARARAAPTAAMVYECLDIHRLMLTHGVIGTALRALEQRLLAASDLLILSSPGFVSGYFEPTHHHLPPVLLLENKLLADDAPGDSMADIVADADRGLIQPGPVWRIGWFGVIRCRRSLHLLAELVQALPGRVEVIIRGRPSHTALPEFAAVLAATPGLQFLGPYDRATELARIYHDVDFVWTLDFYEFPGNSQWLLPNRLYEGSLFGCVPLALAGVETGRWLARHGCGILLGQQPEQPLAAEFQQLFNAMDTPTYTAAREAVCKLARQDLVDSPADQAQAVLVLGSLVRRG